MGGVRTIFCLPHKSQLQIIMGTTTSSSRAPPMVQITSRPDSNEVTASVLDSRSPTRTKVTASPNVDRAIGTVLADQPMPLPRCSICKRHLTADIIKSTGIFCCQCTRCTTYLRVDPVRQVYDVLTSSPVRRASSSREIRITLAITCSLIKISHFQSSNWPSWVCRPQCAMGVAWLWAGLHGPVSAYVRAIVWRQLTRMRSQAPSACTVKHRKVKGSLCYALLAFSTATRSIRIIQTLFPFAVCVILRRHLSC
jgi:hypothetical protein